MNSDAWLLLLNAKTRGMRRCEALAAMGESWENSEAQARACGFLLKHQHEDGGWGESYLSSQDKVRCYLELNSANVLQASI